MGDDSADTFWGRMCCSCIQRVSFHGVYPDGFVPCNYGIARVSVGERCNVRLGNGWHMSLVLDQVTVIGLALTVCVCALGVRCACGASGPETTDSSATPW